MNYARLGFILTLFDYSISIISRSTQTPYTIVRILTPN